MKLIHRLLDLVFPPRCILCRGILRDAETDLCHECRISAPEFPPCQPKIHPSGKSRLHFLDSFTAVWYYEKSVRNSILRYKFHHARNYASGYGRLLGMKLLKEHPEGFDILTWVPVSPWRKLVRGYDQSQLLAEAVGKEIGMEPSSQLIKIRNNRPQSHMSGERRKANVLGVYRSAGDPAVRRKRVLILDDVFTTGATAEECARVLLTAGAREVHCAVIAAAQKHR